MSGAALTAIATLLTWIAWALTFRVVVLAATVLSKVPVSDRTKLSRGFVAAGLAAAMLFILGAAVPKDPTVKFTAPWNFPLTWVVMPFAAWLVVCSLAVAVARLVQAGLSLNPLDRWGRVQAAGIWGLAAIVGWWLYRSDPENKVQILNGGISLQPTTAIALVLALTAGAVAMVVAGRGAASRGFSKTLVTQSALLAGSVVFGIPFVFLLITSFKEPQDMSSPNGIVWVPKVTETVPYMDPKDPQYETNYQGQSVVGHVVKHDPNGKLLVDVVRPFAMAGNSFEASPDQLKEVPKDAKLVSGTLAKTAFTGEVIEELQDGHERVLFKTPPALAGKTDVFQPSDLTAIRKPGLKWTNYPDALEFLPPAARNGLVYLQNTLIIVILSVIGTLLSSSIVAYAFSRMKFPGRGPLFAVLLSTMMLPGAVTLLPSFLIFRYLHWIDTLYPLWVTAFFGSAFNIFLLRQFFMQIPMELEDAAKIDGCSHLKTFWDIMLPQIKPALAVIAIWTFMGAWNNFMGPLIYINSPEHMPLSYALQLFNGDRSGDEPGMVMAFATMCMAPVLLLFFFCQRYFIEGVTLSGLGGR